jgi:hypothetical protein
MRCLHAPTRQLDREFDRTAKTFTRKSDFVAQSDAIKKNLVPMKLTHIANVSHDRHTELRAE